MNIPDAYADERFNPEVDQKSGYRTGSMLTLPMFDQRHQVLGVAQCLNKHGDEPFDDDDVRLLSAIVAEAAIALENSKLYRDLLSRNNELLVAQESLRQKMAELDLLYEVERQISAATHLEQILDGLLAKACELLHAEAGSILLEEDEGGSLYFRAAAGTNPDELRRLRLPPSRGIAGIVARTGTPRVANDVASDPYHDHTVDEALHFRTRTWWRRRSGPGGRSSAPWRSSTSRGGRPSPTRTSRPSPWWPGRRAGPSASARPGRPGSAPSGSHCWGRWSAASSTTSRRP